MTKRTLIFLGVAILAIFATYLSYKYDKENPIEVEPEPEPAPESKTEPEPEPAKTKKGKPTLIPATNEPISEEKAGAAATE